MKNEGGKLKVGVSDLSLWVGRQDHVVDDVFQTVETPHKVAAVPQGVNPHATRHQPQVPKLHRTADWWDLNK